MVTTAEKPRSHSTESVKEAKEVVVLPEETKAPVKAETTKKLSKEPTNLFPKTSLDKIGVKSSKAKELAKEVLGISTIELPETAEYVKEFQRKNKLDPDGQVGVKTYERMKEIADKSDALVKQVEKGFNEYGLSEKTLREISKLLPNMMVQSSNYRKILFYVGKFQTCSKFDSKKTPEVKDLLREIGGQTNEDKKALEKSEKAQSFYATINDKNLTTKQKFEKIIKDPPLLMVGGLLFLFGVIGGGSDYTNSFMKRIGWIIGIGLFGKAAWNKLGLGEMIDDAEKAGSSIIGSVKKGADKAKPAVEDFFKKDLAEMWKSVKGFEFSKIWEGISSKYDKLTSGFASYNETLKDKDGNPKEGYIKEKPLVALTSLMSDEKFLNTSKTDLVNISNITSFNGVVTEKTQKILTDAGVKPADVKNFIKNHLLKNSFGKEKDAKLVKDLLFSTSVKEKLVEQVVKSGKYVDDENLNKEINSQILVLVNSTDSKEKNLGIELAKAIKLGELDKFNFIIFGVSDKTEIKNIIDKVKKYNKFTEELKTKINEIEDINPIISSNVDKSSIKTIIQGDLAELEKITLTSSFDTSDFEDAKNKKLKELLELAQSNNISELTINGTIINVITELEKEEKAKKIIEDKKTIESIEFNNIPGTDKTPNEFYSYLESHKDDFKKVKDFYEKYKSKTGDEEKAVFEIIKKKAKQTEQFKKNYGIVRGKIEDKVGDLKGKVDKIKTDKTQDFETQKEALDELAERYKKEVIAKVFKINTPDWSTIKDIWKQLSTNLVVFDININSIKEIDKYFSLNKGEINFYIGLKQKREELENNYEVKSDISKLDVLNKNSVENITKQIQKEHKFIATNFEFKKDKKLAEIQEKVNEIQDKFIQEIGTAMDLGVLKIIKENYKILKSNTGFYTDGSLINSYLNMFGRNDRVEKKIEEREKLLEKQEEEIEKLKKSQKKEKTNSSNEVKSSFLEKLKKYPFVHEAYYKATNKISEYKALYDKLLNTNNKYKDLIDYLTNNNNNNNNTLFDIYNKLATYKNKEDIKDEVNAILDKLKQI